MSHLGYSWRYGTFNDFDGAFSFDAAKPEESKGQVELKTASVDTNHAERDKHLSSDDFLSVGKHPTATFASTGVTSTGEGTADVAGDLTLNGVTKPVVIAARFIGEGSDPWGGYRAGFEGSTTLKLKDFGITMDLGPASESVELIISVEGVRVSE
jgi:polyisoprenoid-binding protein YceI